MLLTLQSSILISHFRPVNPGRQLHENAAISSTQTPPLIQGEEAHSFISMLQSNPKKRDANVMCSKLIQ